MCVGVGGCPFSVNTENLQTVLYRDSKYNCPALAKAAAACIEWAGKLRDPALDVLISIFIASSRFMHTLPLRAIHDKYAARLVANWATVDR